MSRKPKSDLFWVAMLMFAIGVVLIIDGVIRLMGYLGYIPDWQ